MNLSLIEIVSFKYLLSKIGQRAICDEASSSHLKAYLDCVPLKGKKLIVLDFKDVRAGQASTDEYAKKTYLYLSLKDFLAKSKNINILVTNAFTSVAQVLQDDFPNQENLFILGASLPETGMFKFFDVKEKSEKHFRAYMKNVLGAELNDYAILTNPDEYERFRFALVSQLIAKLIRNHCIHNIEKAELTADRASDLHRLWSTPVHVNKYINTKRLLENEDAFPEICFWLAEKIQAHTQPKYLVVASKNALALAGGITQYIPANILIINQVSPITVLDNFSNIDQSLDLSATYAIVEDFHCMGTELKVVKGILWSRHVDVKNKVYSFPLTSTQIYEDVGFVENKIFPLYKLEEALNYRIFTRTTCPVCNLIQGCHHRSQFDC